MIRQRQGVVKLIIENRPGIQEILVAVEGNEEKALNYAFITGSVEVGDPVLLNTTAVHKRLGSGGYHFVIANLNRTDMDSEEDGHIMKLRYTPYQVKCMTAEEQGSPYREQIERFTSLNGTPVIVGELHSMLSSIVSGIVSIAANRLNVVYIMTDGAALPLPLSRTVYELKDKGLITGTVTYGNAFGGDIETVNIYTALIAAKEVLHADIIVVTMGPGITGTGTTFGFSGLEQGQIINVSSILGGKPILVPRISFGDSRERHRGLSHHTLTVLSKAILTKSTLVLPVLSAQTMDEIHQSLTVVNLPSQLKVVVENGEPALATMNDLNLHPVTMGRTVEQDREFFLAAGAAGIFARKILI